VQGTDANGKLQVLFEARIGHPTPIHTREPGLWSLLRQ